MYANKDNIFNIKRMLIIYKISKGGAVKMFMTYQPKRDKEKRTWF